MLRHRSLYNQRRGYVYRLENTIHFEHSPMHKTKQYFQYLEKRKKVIGQNVTVPLFSLDYIMVDVSPLVKQYI